VRNNEYGGIGAASATEQESGVWKTRVLSGKEDVLPGNGYVLWHRFSNHEDCYGAEEEIS
jgi:hypothetical protein